MKTPAAQNDRILFCFYEAMKKKMWMKKILALIEFEMKFMFITRQMDNESKWYSEMNIHDKQ